VFFLNKLDNTLNILHNNIIEFILCEDTNINNLENCTKKQQLDGLQTTYNPKVWSTF
jgi:hypothetical protein